MVIYTHGDENEIRLVVDDYSIHSINIKEAHIMNLRNVMVFLLIKSR